MIPPSWPSPLRVAILPLQISELSGDVARKQLEGFSRFVLKKAEALGWEVSCPYAAASHTVPPGFLGKIRSGMGLPMSDTRPFHAIEIADPDARIEDLEAAAHGYATKLLLELEAHAGEPSGAQLAPPRAYVHTRNLDELMGALNLKGVVFPDECPARDFLMVLRHDVAPPPGLVWN